MKQTQQYSQQKVLITGNTGFKGTWLTSMLLHLGADVAGLSSFEGQVNPTFLASGIEKDIAQYKVNIRDANSVEQVIRRERPRYIFHLAAQSLTLKGIREPVLTFETNVQGTMNLMEAVRKVNHECTVVIVTSDKCYNNREWCWSYRETDRLFGSDPYGASKSMAENVVHAYYQTYFHHCDHIRVCTVRAGNVFGGGDWSENRIVPDCFRAWREHRPIEIRSPHATRPWSYVLDVLNGYLTAASAMEKQQQLNGESFNFGPISTEPIPVLDLVTRMWNLFDESGAPVPVIIQHSNEIRLENEQLRLSSDKALSVLGWRPVYDFPRSLSDTVSWYRSHMEECEDIRSLTEKLTTDFLKDASCATD